MNPNEKQLWQKIQAFQLDDPKAKLTFSQRLARENAWSNQYTAEVITEYKKFMFLLCVCEHPVTPSDQIDQVWHLHLIYTQSYWEDFCDGVLGKKVHHGPTKGGLLENKKYTNLYELTQLAYQKYFETEPPKEIWWETQKRFQQIRFQRVNTHTHWIVPKLNLKLQSRKFTLASMLVILTVLWSCTNDGNPYKSTSTIAIVCGFFVFYVILLRAMTKNDFRNTEKKKSNDGSSSSSTGSSLDSSPSTGSSFDSSSSSDSGSSWSSFFGGGDFGGGGADSSGCSSSGCSSGCGGGGCGGGGD